MKKAFFNWSTGKDSALALHHILQDDRFSIEHLLTTVNAHFGRVSMHGLRTELLQKQVERLGIPSSVIELPENPSNEEYEQLMAQKVSALKQEGFDFAVFGDIFLEDLKNYREKQLEKLQLQAVFPLWKRDTRELMHEFIDLGFKAITVCVNGNLLPKEFAGKTLDHDFIKALPKNVDPCGENGEFHTFCYDGPIFKSPVKFEVGEIVERSYTSADFNSTFYFCDLLATNG